MVENTKSRGRPGFFLGLGLGVVLTFLVAFMLAFFWVKQKEHQVRRGWNLVPVVSLAEDVPAGTVLTYDHISQRSFPEQFVTASVIKPADAATAVGKRLIAPMRRGEMLLHTSLWQGTEQDLTACRERNVAPEKDPAPQP
ncbi:SAF domain-containing protein [Melittangium boletus]|uniref:Pilus assembly protein CpaB n=1 Tax=Melittangium boletus DSM 14713 TaxID=1294270 RepID=A0A250IFR7_9BACT|nr:SAF domain-containing protein [Melittangium boletus]ATB30060.1 pilus assembly protein CpaB [Melittangium boletus DSM 14713]